ncbi:MAG TPA: 23S rRNA (guanosine(2251)-2'-O)-methyltransferase RlmB [Bacteroidales bacterium]|nr:23S rRNA (guanosine(2251)-2'-O)-methyltransferase RlmB [Bacteroidales bacterium]HPI67582.1 23S rRNA (guanosine(2251)-2'-O)-methyltransferase RlmB [Bacteroidales bacterium]HPR73516.1 23S rRNA (guanosine(2251)-2'-O)-methyltransferase RlmB [Bacteroidales bacterium]
MQKESDCIFGLRPVIEAIKAGKQLDRLLIRQGLQGSLYRELMSLVRTHNIVYQIVPVERIELVTRKNHQGVLAWLSSIEYQNLSNLLPMIYERGEDPLIIVLDGISDVRNFGAISRTAESLGVHALVIPERGSARITADAIKTSAGALHTLPVCRERSVVRTVEYLRKSGLKVICSAENSGQEISATDLTGPLALILGSEDKGVSRELTSIADHLVNIPTVGTISSLNVSVAAGILIYEIARQRKSAK